MIDHKYEGCPTNSECSKEMGTFYKSWIKVLKSKNIVKMQSFYNKNGLPLEVWVKKKHTNKNIILWDSRCKNHNSGASYIKPALVRGKSFHEIKSSDNFDVRRALILSNKLMTPYIISNTDLPLYSSSHGLTFLKSVNGNYFGQLVSPQGLTTFIKTKKPKNYPRTVTCPTLLKKEYAKLKHTSGLYSGHFCQKLWNVTRKDFDILMTGWDCN
jgi:hypothetical protein